MYDIQSWWLCGGRINGFGKPIVKNKPKISYWYDYDLSGGKGKGVKFGVFDEIFVARFATCGKKVIKGRS